MDYLTYAYLQLARDTEAVQMLSDLRAMPSLSTSQFKVGYAASAMPVRYCIERQQWKDAAQLAPLADAPPQGLAITLWARAVGLARDGKPTLARQEVEKLRAAREQLAAAGDSYWATQVHVQINEALAWVARAEGKNDEAVKLMRDAADQEDAIEKRPVTPGPIVPAREQLGDLLLALSQPKEALKEFEAALVLAPQRRGALKGAEHATVLAGQKK